MSGSDRSNRQQRDTRVQLLLIDALHHWACGRSSQQVDHSGLGWNQFQLKRRQCGARLVNRDRIVVLVGSLASICLIWAIAACCSGPQTNSSFFRVKRVIGSAIDEKFGIYSRKYDARPWNCWTSFWLVGSGKSSTALTLPGMGRTSSLQMMCPTNSTCGWENWHFSRLSLTLWLLSLSKTCLRRASCSCLVLA